MIAYIDPGSGALLWQMLLASSIGILFFAKKIWHFTIQLFTKKKNDPESE